MPVTSYRTCPLCEATCGLEITVDDGRVTRIRGDRADVFSKGFICPKGSTLGELHEDPDRLRRPQIRRGETWTSVTWEEAFAEIEARLLPIREQHGRNSIGVYLGNPNVHGLAGTLYVRPLVKALGTRSVFSASTVDQMPKHVSSGLMFGHPLTIPVPDIDRTDYLLMMGANPKASNGSLATAPDWPGRMEAIRGRGGRIVVVDPRRTESAEMADEHLFIRPGTDAAWLAALVTEVMRLGKVDAGRLTDHTRGLDRLPEVLEGLDADRVDRLTGIPAATTRRIAAELAAAPTAVVYGRLGTHAAAFGTLASWLTDVLNLITGNLDRPGGAMFPRAATETPRRRPFTTGRWHSRVRQHPEALGELPVAALAEEILTPGDGQIRALITVAGNPARSTPDSEGLARALESLEFMVSVDIYVNETTRHADVILPGPSQLQRGHYDVFLSALAIRNVAHYTPPVLPLDDGAPDEWEILARLAGGEPDAVTDGILAEMVQAALTDDMSPLHGRDPSEVTGLLGSRRGPERILDLMLRTGPYRLTLDDLLAAPHGLDHGPLVPRLPDVLRTPSGMAELAPEPLIADVARLEAALDGGGAPVGGEAGFVLVGRRHLRSNNSWMHNVKVLVKGKPRCTLQVHPDDADRLGLADGDPADVTSRTGKLTAPVEVTDSIRPGVVSLPHGWGHNVPGVVLAVASEHAGVNSNLLADEEAFDPLSGNAVLNGIPVQVNRVAS